MRRSNMGDVKVNEQGQRATKRTSRRMQWLAASVFFARPGPYPAGLATMLAISLWTVLYFFFADLEPENTA